MSGADTTSEVDVLLTAERANLATFSNVVAALDQAERALALAREEIVAVNRRMRGAEDKARKGAAELAAARAEYARQVERMSMLLNTEGHAKTKAEAALADAERQIKELDRCRADARRTEGIAVGHAHDARRERDEALAKLAAAIERASTAERHVERAMNDGNPVRGWTKTGKDLDATNTRIAELAAVACPTPPDADLISARVVVRGSLLSPKATVDAEVKAFTRHFGEPPTRAERQAIAEHLRAQALEMDRIEPAPLVDKSPCAWCEATTGTAFHLATMDVAHRHPLCEACRELYSVGAIHTLGIRARVASRHVVPVDPPEEEIPAAGDPT